MGALIIRASNSNGTGEQKQSMHITAFPRSTYDGNLKSSYQIASNQIYGVSTPKPTSNSSTGTYNCLAHSVGINTQWQWPWNSNDPEFSAVSDYMLKCGAHANRPGNAYSQASQTIMSGCNAIFYTGGHAAKVAAWDSAGNATMIISKWGYAETIQNASISPFSTNS